MKKYQVSVVVTKEWGTIIEVEAESEDEAEEKAEAIALDMDANEWDLISDDIEVTDVKED